MNQQTKNKVLIGVIILILMTLLTVIVIIFSKLPVSSEDSDSLDSEISPNTVIRIIDGDTFELASGDIVRLLCVDAPEKGKPGAEEAEDFLFSLIYNKELRLESDVEDKDAYGRLLRYAYVISEDGEEIFINKELFQKGYADIFPYGNSTAKCQEIEGMEN